MFIVIISTLAMVSAHWSYEHPELWGDADALVGTSSDGQTNYCGTTFNTQSPIDVISGSMKTCPSSDKLDWSLNTDITKFTASNTGHNIKIVPDDSNDFGKLKNNFKTSSGQHDEYCLDAFHIHWGQTDGTGSEHLIDNKQNELEMHFVHYSCDYKSLTEALQATPTDKYVLAVVSVLYTVGAENAFIKKITDSVLNLRDEHATLTIQGVNMGQVIPGNGDDSGSNDDDSGSNKFYHYKGSLTTPPCDPIVSWHVLETKMTLSEEQLTKLRGSVFNHDDGLSAPNYRPAQTNQNDVYLCPASDDDDDDEKDD